MAYFSNFPKINYFDVTSRNIILKAAIVQKVFDKTDAFYRYIIPEGYRPDMVANDVYNNPTFDWVVYFSNSVVDPYYNWPLHGEDFKLYLEKKYDKTIYELQNQTSHYYYSGITNDSANDIARKSWKMSVETYNNLSAEDRSGWTAKSVYDYEDELNEAKRSIRLLSPVYLKQITQELSEIFSK